MNWSSDYLVVFATDVTDAVVRKHVSTTYVVGDISPFGNVSLIFKHSDIPSYLLLMLFDVFIETGHRIFYIFRGFDTGLDISNDFHIDTSLFGILRGLLFETSQFVELGLKLFDFPLELRLFAVGFESFDAGRFNLFDFIFEHVQSRLLAIGEHFAPFRYIENSLRGVFGVELIDSIDILLIEYLQSDELTTRGVVRRQLYLPFVGLLFEHELARVGVAKLIGELKKAVVNFGDGVHRYTSLRFRLFDGIFHHRKGLI